jgi:predicted helicase
VARHRDLLEPSQAEDGSRQMTDRFLTTANSWADIVKNVNRLPSQERGELFEQLTQLLLQVAPIYRQKLRHVWRHRQVPHPVRRGLGLPVQDIGIDLVAETTTGDYWAIQCKYHDDPHQHLTLNELRPFLHTAHTVCRERFSALLVVSSANGYAPMLRRHSPEVQYILGDTFRALDKEFFGGVRALLRHQPPRLVAAKPKPHQQRAIRNAVTHFKINKESRGKLIHPCGSGKSLTAFWIADALGAKRILVAVPSLQLVRQQLGMWARESVAKKQSIEWIVVCSEEKIGSIEKDDPSIHPQDLGIQVTTDPSELTAFLSRRQKGYRVVFTTYQSGKVVSQAARKAKFTFDLGIYDEAHKTVGAESSLFGELLSEDKIAVRKRVFMTATERRYRGDSDKILSMDDQEIYGNAFDVMTFREALEQKILSDYRVITSVVSLAEVRDLVERNLLVLPDTGNWSEDTEARTLAAVVALRKSMQRHRFSHALSFHSSVAKAKAFRDMQSSFSEAAPEFGALECFHVSGKDSTGERQERIEEFIHARYGLMTNARCLTEGVDVPKIDAVLFADPKQSAIDIVQAVGRALRRSKGKQLGFVIVPILVDEKDHQVADRAYTQVLITLRALVVSCQVVYEGTWFSGSC